MKKLIIILLVVFTQLSFGQSKITIKTGSSATNKLDTSGTYVTAGAISWPGTIYSTPTTGSYSGHFLTFSPSLTSQSAYTLFGRGSGSGTPSFLASIDSNWVTGLHTEGYYNTKYAATGGGGGTLAIGSTVTSGTSGSILFVGSGGKLSQINTKLFYDSANIRVGIGVAAPTALLHIAAGTATASTAPLKFTAGTILSTPEAGTIEYRTGSFVIQSDKLTLGSSATPSAQYYFTTANDAAPSTVTAWDSRHTIFGAGGGTGGGVGFSNTASTSTENILFLAPNVAWQNANFNGHTFSFKSDGTFQGLYQDGAGKIGIGTTSPTALLHLKAGTATASTAPLKFTAGVVLSTPESGVIETNASNELMYSTTTTTASRGFISVERYIAKTSTYTATANDYTIDCTSGTFTVTLPTAVGVAGRVYIITNSGAGTITVGTTSSQTFANVTATPTTLTMAALGARTVQSNGANWLLINSL